MKTTRKEFEEFPDNESLIAYIMSRFPKVTETFILREMIELEKIGQPILILPLLPVNEPVIHHDVNYLMNKVSFTPFISLDILSANFRFLIRDAEKYLKILWIALKGNFGSANLFIGALGIFPKSVFFAQTIEEKGVRHVHAHYATHPALSALIISELTGISFSFTAHAHDIFVHKRMLEEKIRKARFVVTISEFNKRYILKLCPEINENKIKVVHCGVDLGMYSSQYASKARAIDYNVHTKTVHGINNHLLILCVASLQPYKGIDCLLRACSLLKNHPIRFRCQIVGEGKERKRLEDLITDLNLNEEVVLLGNQTQEMVAELLGKFDLFVCSSVVAENGQMEGIPVAIMEAMASGLPVVATDISGIPELVEDGVTGILVPPRNERALADAIIKLYYDETLRKDMGRRGREKVAADFELKSTVAKLKCLFTSIIDQTTKDRSFEDEIRKSIKETMRKRFSEHTGGDDIENIDLRPIGSGHDSKGYEVTIKNHKNEFPPLILKIHISKNNQTNDHTELATKNSDREYNSLLSLWKKFNQQSNCFRVPRPIAYFPEFAGILMEKCQGERFDQSLRWIRFLAAKSDIAGISNNAKACGEWLGLFHRVTEKEDDPSTVYKRIESEFHDDLETCTKIGLHSELANRIANFFEDRKDIAFNGGHKLVGHHCDFGPYNVFISSDLVTVIDFEGMMDGIIYDDICYFLCMIDTIPPYHLKHKIRIRIRERFLEGYSKYQTVDQDEFRFFMVINMVKIMSRNPAFRKGANTWLSRLRSYQKFKMFQSRFEEQLFDKRIV